MELRLLRPLEASGVGSASLVRWVNIPSIVLTIYADSLDRVARNLSRTRRSLRGTANRSVRRALVSSLEMRFEGLAVVSFQLCDFVLQLVRIYITRIIVVSLVLPCFIPVA